MNIELLGWASSLILLVTIGKQLHKQWQERTSEGVSIWLFVGQLAASAGFTLYSFLIHNWIFVATNALMTASAAIGAIIVLRHRSGNMTGRQLGGSEFKPITANDRADA